LKYVGNIELVSIMSRTSLERKHLAQINLRVFYILRPNIPLL